MPYYLNHLTKDPMIGNFNGTRSGFRQVWRETSFRTKPPEGLGTKQLKLSAVEPWTWHESYETMKARNFERQNPGSAFAKDRGHVWSSEKYFVQGEALSGVYHSNYFNRGDVLTPYVVFPSVVPSIAPGIKDWRYLSPSSDLESYGALAYTQASPLSDEFSLPAFVGELREGLPSLIPIVFAKNTAGWSQAFKARLRDAKNAGSDYLNVQFGWIPLVNDVISIATALAKATVALTAMDEIHRYRELPINDVTSIWENGRRGDYCSHPTFPADLVSTLQLTSPITGASALKGTSTYIQNRYSRMWFEGNFVRLPKASLGLDRHMDQFDWLIKTDLTPSDLWQIAPWSWLVDWFIDIGGLIDAFQTGTSNRILSTYAYAMCEERTTTAVVLRNISPDFATNTVRSWDGPKDYSCHYQAHRKRRIRANPFGFILNPSVNLNVAQLAIMAALGLTKIK